MKRYVYVGGGYFRDASVPKGEPAEILHGDEATRPLVALLGGLRERLMHATCAGVEQWPEYKSLVEFFGD